MEKNFVLFLEDVGDKRGYKNVVYECWEESLINVIV